MGIKDVASSCDIDSCVGCEIEVVIGIAVSLLSASIGACNNLHSRRQAERGNGIYAFSMCMHAACCASVSLMVETLEKLCAVPAPSCGRLER